MKSLLFYLILSIVTLSGTAQLNRNISLNVTGNFNFDTQGFRTLDDAGVGFGTTAIFFAKNKWGLSADGGVDIFFGDKGLYVGGNEGLRNSSPIFQSLRAGPHFFASKRIILAALYGTTRYCAREQDYRFGQSYKLSATALLGKKRNLVTRLSYVGVLRDISNLRYLSLSLGCRVF